MHLLLGICLINTFFSLALFLHCYFPVKKGLEGYASLNSVSQDIVNSLEVKPATTFHRLVLVVIDALRADFVLGTSDFMPFTRFKLHEGNGVSFLAKTQTPTVTLPRIKAITTGSIPGFVDVVLNFGSTALYEDNIVTQLTRAGKILTFFGDDTWLRLFPDHFIRSDGTTSFFVTDYTEVDVNVTRHLSKELASDDWDVMILHYLGLDHIGHISGPSSSLVPPKLQEMDNVIQQIYTAMQSWNHSQKPSFLAICGDHGMSDQGGHGGASPGEVTVPVIFLSPHIKFSSQQMSGKHIQQIDLCPTLSALLDLPIPKNNIGQVEVAALPENMSLQDKVWHVYMNAVQIAQILEANVADLDRVSSYQLYQESLRRHRTWQETKNISSSLSWEIVGLQVMASYQECIQKMSQHIINMSTHFDMYGICIAITILWMNLIALLLMRRADRNLLSLIQNPMQLTFIFLMAAIFSHISICTSYNSTLCGTGTGTLLLQLLTFALFGISCQLLVALLVPVTPVTPVTPVFLNTFKLLILPLASIPELLWLNSEFLLHLLAQVSILKAGFVQKSKVGFCEHLNSRELFLFICLALHSISLLSSSFVEEEHQSWYFFVTSLHVLILLHLIASYVVDAELHVHGVKSFIMANQAPYVLELTPCNSDKLSEHDTSVHSNNMQTELTSACGENKPIQHISVQGHRQTGPALSVFEFFSTTASTLGILVLCRVMRRWNQTGNKWLDIPDVGDWFLRPENKLQLSLLVILSLMCIQLSRLVKLKTLTAKLSVIGAHVAVYCSKTGTGALLLPDALAANLSAQGVTEARIGYVFLLIFVIDALCQYSCLKNCLESQNAETLEMNTKKRLKRNTRKIFERNRQDLELLKCLQVAWLTLTCLLLRSHNMALVALMSVMECLVDGIISRITLRPSYVLLYCLTMGQAAFFFQGNSNSLSTIDVSAGYTALHDYQPVFIAVQMCLSTYAGIIFWLIACLKYVTRQALSQQSPDWLATAYADISFTILVVRTLPLAMYTVLVTVQRYHLFVWTVFSPKLLYEGMLTVVLFLFCMICLLACKLKCYVNQFN